jgi:cytochrome oxidase Cu insertion factor (SCO1/SenC/PrrC family)
MLRLAFGSLWILDGLLQLQNAMPLGMPTAVLQPSASSSPGWVQSVVNFGADIWSRHPTSAAASVVWIQVGIGIFILVAPRGTWSRAAGLVGIGWGLVVWVFGEAFGSLFAPGSTVLFGAPGGVLLYVVAAGLLVLPERVWIGARLGRAILGCAGAFLLGMALLQAWPGRGFWSGGSASRPGTLAAMARTMAATPQPRALSTAVASFASFDQSHGFGVNLFVVIALAATGAALLSGLRQLLYPTILVLVVLGVADWVLIEDFGVWGGTGTDPNSMVPLLVLLFAGYLASTRAPAAETVEALRQTTASRGVEHRGGWELLDPSYLGRVAAAVAAIAVILIGTGPMVAASVNTRTDDDLAVALDGAPQASSGAAPDFHLVDQDGRPVSLASLRGFTVAMTFLDPVCTTDCPVIAQEFKNASELLGASADRVRFVAIAANPQYHSVAVIDDFDREEGLSTQANWLFLTGSGETLTTVLNSYGVAVANGIAGSMTIHADTAYVIDARGVVRWILDADPGSTGTEHASFSDLLVTRIEQAMQS